MDWKSLLLDSRIVSAFYLTSPSLDAVEIFDIFVGRRGGDVTIRFDTRDFPDKVPPKWLAGKFNKAQIVINLVSVTDFSLSGVLTTAPSDITIERLGGGIFVCIDSTTYSMRAQAEFIRVESISGYQALDDNDS